MTAQRATLPRVSVGQSAPVPVLGRTEVAGGRVYYVRWGATTVHDFGLDGRGQAVHAKIIRTALGEACGVSPVPGINIDTDFGDRVVYLPTGEPLPLMMPEWHVDLETGIYIPHDMTAQVEIIGGDPLSTATAWPAFHSRRLQPWEPPPPLRCTFQNAPAATEVTLVDLIVGTEITPADLRGAVSLMCPEFATPALTCQLWYNLAGTDSRTISMFPGVSVSLAGCWKVILLDRGHWEFGIEL
jgi:hypothetical protein